MGFFIGDFMPRQSERWLTPLASSATVSSASSGQAGQIYISTSTTLTSGATIPLFADENGNTKVREQYAPGYEDNVAGVAKFEVRGARTTLVSASTVLAKSGAGMFYSFNIGMPSCPTIAFYDSLVPSGTLIQRIHAGYPVGTHSMNIELSNGLTVDAIGGGGGVAPSIMTSTR